MSTPFGRRGHFWKIWNEERDLWEWFEITAELCPRISADFLAEERRTNIWFEQEYHCKFLENVDGVFTYDEVAGMLSGLVEPLDDLGVSEW